MLRFVVCAHPPTGQVVAVLPIVGELTARGHNVGCSTGLAEAGGLAGRPAIDVLPGTSVLAGTTYA